MSKEYIINEQCGKAFKVAKGNIITIIDIKGQQVADFFAINLRNTNEFLSTGVTIDCNNCIKLRKFDTIYTNLYNPMFKVLEDDVEEHDLIHPCCRQEMYEFFYKNGRNHKNCLDNINNNISQYGIPAKNIIYPINFFMHTDIKEDGTVSVKTPCSKAGDKIVLTAEIDAIIGIAACSVSESKCNGYGCTDIKIKID